MEEKTTDEVIHLNIAIIDDDLQDTERLTAFLAEWSEEHHLNFSVSVFHESTVFLDTLKGRRYNLVFMDIYMGPPGGIETASKLREYDSQAILIFLTSSPEHMPDAFHCHAFDYLIKPIDNERLRKTILDALAFLPEKEEYLELPVRKQNVPIFYSDIRYVLASSNYCMVYTKEEYRCRMSFSQFEKLLEKDGRFLTINRGVLINLDYAESMDGLICLMKDKRTFPLNTRKHTQLEQALIEHRFRRRKEKLQRRS